MLLADQPALPGSSMRTLRLSTQSFLGAVIYEDSKALYTLETEDAQTRLSRYSDKATGSAKQIALVAWSELESPDTSPVDSPATFKTRLFQSWTGKDSKEDRGVSIEFAGRRMKQSELLKTSALGGSRSFTGDGKSFKWKHTNGLWQCFHSKCMVAVFEPSILTAPARIRLMSPEVSTTRRALDMVILTCLLVVTHPADWRRHQASVRTDPHSSPRQTVTRQRSMAEVPSRSARSISLRRAPSNDEVRTSATMVFRHDTDSHAPLSSTAPASSQQHSLTPIVQSIPAVSGRVTPPLVLSRLTIPTSTPEESPITPARWTPVRRALSVDELRTPVSRSLPASPAHALTIVSRASTRPISSIEHSRTLRRSPSANAISSPNRSSLFLSHRLRTRPSVSILPSVPDETVLSLERYSTESDLSASPSATDTYNSTPSGRRPWEYVDAYPIPYTAVQPSTPVAGRNDASPPPYSRRDPLTSAPVPRSPRQPAHTRTNSVPRPERNVQLVLVS
ncbi:hypothetical protein FRB93_004228 [Tulasnella sp. JGI-2019a]|nr:hypothetical protein FRB93_004228 [Tulasnella sp. JGI-2019a]